ncbi:MAG: lipopolysaccharide biosynthesis protein [Candidatus Anammoxibacter sp.]
MKQQQTSRNVLMVITQVIVTGVTLFILYRYLLETIGVVLLGVWSIVLASASASRITELGLSGSVVKFVSKYLALSEPEKSAKVIETVCISIGVILAGFLFLIYPVIAWALAYFIPEENIQVALRILPYALVSLWLMTIAEIFLAGLDGCRRFDLRGIVMMVGSIFYLVTAILLVPRYSLEGLVVGQICQAVLLLLMGWVLLKRQLKGLSLIPYRWSYSLFREMIVYGVNFQIIGIIQLLIDPATKMLLSKFGGLASVGFYEMANKMVMQLWKLLVTANQTMVPHISKMQELEPDRIKQVYKQIYDTVLYINLPFYAAILAVLPAIGEIWLGNYEPAFVYMAFLLIIGRFFNSMSGPAFFTFLGTGKLRWNTIDYVTMGILNIGLGYLLGLLYGNIGVVIGVTIALVVGSAIPTIAYHIENKISFRDLLPDETRMLLITSVSGTVFSLLVYYVFHNRLGCFVILPLCLTIFTSIVLQPFWSHPLRSELIKKFIVKTNS